MKPDRRIHRLAERIDADTVTVSVIYDRTPAQAGYRWEATATWLRHGDELHLGGETVGRSLDAVLDHLEAEINGHLLRDRAGGD